MPEGCEMLIVFRLTELRSTSWLKVNSIGRLICHVPPFGTETASMRNELPPAEPEELLLPPPQPEPAASARLKRDACSAMERGAVGMVGKTLGGEGSGREMCFGIRDGRRSPGPRP